MAKIKLNLPLGEAAVTGKMVTFVAPCDCSGVEAIQIDGVDYAVCDTMDTPLLGRGRLWSVGAEVSVILNVEKKKACMLNGAPVITDEQIREICT